MRPENKAIILDEQQRGYDGFFKIDKLIFKHSLNRGGLSPKIAREVFQRGQAVVVLLYDLEAEMIALVEQCRAGAIPWVGKDHHEAWLLEPVAGMIDEGETAQAAAEREAKEEAGVEIHSLEPICQYYPTPGGCSEILHLFAAPVDVPALPELAGLEDEVEDIRIVKIPFSEAKAKLIAADFNVSSTIICLQWLFFQKLSTE